MSEEKTTEIKQEKECKCFCKSEGFRNFLITALGTFVGVYCALSLFSLAHKPCMPKPYFMPPMMQQQGQFMPPRHHGHHGMHKFMPKEFRGEMNKGKEIQKPDVND